MAAGKRSLALLAWLPLLQGGEDPRTAQRWADLFRGQGDEALLADLGGIARVFADLAGRQPAWFPIPEHWNMERSAFLVEREKRGEQRGELRTLRECLRQALETRINQALSPEEIQAIDSTQDPTVLKQRFTQALSAGTHADARKVLGLEK